MKNNDITLTMIKPAAFKNNHAGSILKIIYENGFQIIALKIFQLTFYNAQQFYIIHKDKPFYEELCKYMSSGPIVAAILKKENAVNNYRKLIGTTDPAKAEKGTIRSLFGTSIQKNSVHGSDSDENAKIECDFFFSELERF